MTEPKITLETALEQRAELLDALQEAHDYLMFFRNPGHKKVPPDPIPKIQRIIARVAVTDLKGGKTSSLRGRLVEMGDMEDGNGDKLSGVLIECTRDDLRNCNLRMYGFVKIANVDSENA